MEVVTLILPFVILIISILVLRAIGAWMLRINDVISELKEINRKLDRMNKS